MYRLPELGNAPLKQPSGALLEVKGFKGIGQKAGIRNDGREDLALIVADKVVPTAAVFTQNPLTAAPVTVSKIHIAQKKAKAIIANSGCANAATGKAGYKACVKTCYKAAEVLGCEPSEILPCSTGVIGQVLDADKVCNVLPDMAKNLSAEGLDSASKAIMTTDAFCKTARREITIADKPVVIAAMAKGAGMIRPDMATMLSFVLTDCNIKAPALEKALRKAVAFSFNRITVDGDTSTNDTLIAMASGEAQNPELKPADKDFEVFCEGLCEVCQDLATMMIADGEGAGHLVRVRVKGTPDQEAARYICYAIGHSPLSKTAFAGSDPNWGRFISAGANEAFRRGKPFDADKTDLWIGDTLLVKKGVWCGEQAEEQAFKTMKQDRFEIVLDLGLGEESFWILTSDLDHKYIDINVDYRS